MAVSFDDIIDDSPQSVRTDTGTASAPSSAKTSFTPSPGATAFTFDREFADTQQALDWLTIQGKTFPRKYLCCMTLRSGAVETIERIEKGLYATGTAASDDFHIVQVMWASLSWYVLSIPAVDVNRLSDLIEKGTPSMRIAWGEPHCFMDAATNRTAYGAWREEKSEPGASKSSPKSRRSGAICFPLAGANVGTLEYLRREPGPVVFGFGIKGEGASVL